MPVDQNVSHFLSAAEFVFSGIRKSFILKIPCLSELHQNHTYTLRIMSCDDITFLS